MGCDHQSYSYDACSSAFSIVRSGYYSSIISFSSNGSSTISFYLTFSMGTLSYWRIFLWSSCSCCCWYFYFCFCVFYSSILSAFCCISRNFCFYCSCWWNFLIVSYFTFCFIRSCYFLYSYANAYVFVSLSFYFATFSYLCICFTLSFYFLNYYCFCFNFSNFYFTSFFSTLLVATAYFIFYSF